jgi:hypothetical protein
MSSKKEGNKVSLIYLSNVELGAVPSWGILPLPKKISDLDKGKKVIVSVARFAAEIYVPRLPSFYFRQDGK